MEMDVSTTQGSAFKKAIVELADEETIEGVPTT